MLLHYPGVNYTVYLQPGTQPPAGPLYSMSRDELQVLKKYLEDNLSKRFIRNLSSPATAPVLFVKKLAGSLQFCVNYCSLNTLIIKNKYLLPVNKKILKQLYNVVYFIKLNIVTAFNKISRAVREEWKTVFRTLLDLYKYLVIPFGLVNTLNFF